MLPAQELSATLQPKGPGHKKRSTACAQVLELQELLMGDARCGDVKGVARAQIARAWVDLQEMRLRLAMKPAPKPVDVSDRQPAARRRRAKAAEPITPEPVPGSAPKP